MSILLTEATEPPAGSSAHGHGHSPRSSALSLAQIRAALPGAFKKLDPRLMWHSPVMFIVLIGALLTTALVIAEPFLKPAPGAENSQEPWGFTAAVAAWLWLTVLFANLAESVAEGRGKAQAASLRASRTSTMAGLLEGYDPHSDPTGSGLNTTQVPSTELHIGDYVRISAGELVPGDGEIVYGIAAIDESAITGESAPVIRESGGDRSAVTGGTTVISDAIIVKITTAVGDSLVDRMIRLVEGAQRQKTPNEIALNILLATLSVIFMVVVLALNPIAAYSHAQVSLPVLIALLVCLIPTTIGALLSAIGIAGMDRLIQHNVLALSGRAVEAAGDITTLLLDKTGTITYGNRQAAEFHPLSGVTQDQLAAAAATASVADATPEGQSILALAAALGVRPPRNPDGVSVEFTAQTRMSGIDFTDGSSLRKGAGSAILGWTGQVAALEAGRRQELDSIIEKISTVGGTPLVVATRTSNSAAVLGVVYLKDVVKQGLAERFAQLRAMGIRTVMVTGDNPRTAAAIAAETGVDDFLAEATPEEKMKLIRAEQAGGNLVAMTGDGTNDAPALAQADVGMAMNSGTSAAKEAGNMVDLDSDPTKLIDVVRIGKQLLITRGALTTFSIANDVAKYFAIIPAMFSIVFPGLAVLNIMGLSTPASAILSAVIFNALVIIFLIPLALRGVKYHPRSAAATLNRNLLIYGLGGVIVPFLGIKLIDLLISLIPGF